MSSRALRRLQEQKELEEATKADHENDQDVAQVVKKKTKKKKGNMFDLLAEEVESPEEKDEEQEHHETKQEPNDEETQVIVSKSTRKRKKKKKKNAENNMCKEDLDDEELDEVDRANRLLGITACQRQQDDTSNDGAVLRNKSILAIDFRNLNPENEMKRKFGSSIINQEKRRNPHERRYKRTTKLVTPKENWPRFSKVGLIMTQDRSTESPSSTSSTFTFEHQASYQKVEFLFFDAVESMDHNNIMHLLNAHPYHVSSLLQLSEVCKINEDHQMAAELIERALFVFENGFHTLFNMTLGTCRVNYKRSESRPFFLALFRHIRYIGDRACYRTALEFCKVLLGLDPSEDPLCVLLLIDYYAIKAEEYQYFVQLYDEFEVRRNVSMLPNFVYSCALAYFYLEKVEEANNTLKSALLQFPSLLVELMDKCGISLDDSIKKHPYFDPVSYLTQSPALNQLVALYVGRAYPLWKAPEVINWLVSVCKEIVDDFDAYKNKIEKAKEMNHVKRNAVFVCLEGQQDTEYHPEMFYGISSFQNALQIIIHVRLDIKEAMRQLPVEIRNQTILMHDPLPPADSITGYERPKRDNRPEQSGNLLSLFFQSLMPSYNQVGADGQQYQQRQPAARELQGEARAAPPNDDAGEGLRTGAESLMNAMRELLNTMTYRNDLEDDENENEENDEQWQ